MQHIYCSIITIGDELLIGQTIDTNSAWIAQQLNPLGIQIRKRIAIGDDESEMIFVLQEEEKKSDIIIITGGLGPTNDDITKGVLCNYFKTELVMNNEVLLHVKALFEKRKRPMLAINNNQAMVPKNCQVLFNEVGTAPGLLFFKNQKTIIALPGVPFEMQYLITTHVLSFLKEKYQTPNFIHKTVITSGEGESFIANRLIDFEKILPPHIKLAYLPTLGTVKLRLTGTEIEEDLLEKYFKDLQFILSDIVVETQDILLEQIVKNSLENQSATLSLAESCTGGFIASRITSMKGSSSTFKGGVVAYSNESKINQLGVKKESIELHTAVSKQVAIEMVENCLQKFNTTYALSITGYVEKNDHNNEVWIAIACKNKTETKQIFMPYDREKNTVLATNTALNLLRKFILENNN